MNSSKTTGKVQNKKTIKTPTTKKPLFWPLSRKWPPSDGRWIERTEPFFPPVYILNDGTEVKGKWPLKRKTSTKKNTNV